MAILPNEFPVVLTIFLALGAWRISQNQVLTRRMPAVETLGSATVLCVDKTGTLTLNQMSVQQMMVRGEFYDVTLHQRQPLPETFHQLVEFGILASQKDPFDIAICLVGGAVSILWFELLKLLNRKPH